MSVLELRTYRLHPGSTAEFAATMGGRSVPLLIRYGITVVWHGPSADNEDGVEEYALVRRYRSLAERTEQEERFYTSVDWRSGLGDEVMRHIEQYQTVVIDQNDCPTGWDDPTG